MDFYSFLDSDSDSDSEMNKVNEKTNEVESVVVKNCFDNNTFVKKICSYFIHGFTQKK